ncbi:MAG: LacI family DNA-binding transcriptional regulator [Actinomycetales bacterium]|nr:LacI family DNA-binding transcriptional regulator [Actinomycetales bacterium]
MPKRPTIHDVAEAAGVSIATVSKAVNGRYGVADETARRVFDAVEALNYESSLVARSMRSRRTGVVGVLVPAFEPFSTEVLKGVGAALRETDLDLMAYAGAGQPHGAGWERRSLSRLSGTLVDGAILVTPTVVDVAVEIPVVAIDPHTGPGQLPTVASDNDAGAMLATRHLIELGHRRIAFLAGRGDLLSSQLRERGYRAALREAGIRYDPELVGIGDYSVESSRPTAHQLLSRPDRPTALFAANDLSAIATLGAAAELGIEVPEELSVVGFDDIPEASRTTPPLTTVRQSMQLLGRTAAEMLLALMAGETLERHDLTLGTRMVIRGSTAHLGGAAPSASARPDAPSTSVRTGRRGTTGASAART